MEPRSEHIRTCDNCGEQYGIPDDFIADVDALAKEDGYTCNGCAESHNALVEAYTIEAGYPEVHTEDVEDEIDRKAERFPGGEDPMQKPRITTRCVNCEHEFDTWEGHQIICPECHTPHDMEGNEFRGCVYSNFFMPTNLKGYTAIYFLLTDSDVDTINCIKKHGLDYVVNRTSQNRMQLEKILNHLAVIINREEFKKAHEETQARTTSDTPPPHLSD